ncbi:MAG: hypothetical protein NVSMB66_1920 [Candidatus Doudnabacteria bacterium]
MWYSYLLICLDDTIYGGISKDVAKRFLMHQNGKGAHYTKVHGAKEIVYIKSHRTRSSALKHEYKIKHLKRDEKLKLIFDYKRSHK